MTDREQKLRKAQNGKLVAAGVPIYASNFFPEFAQSYWQSINSLKFAATIDVNGDSLITRARNNIAHDFLQTDCTHLMFMDSDLEFLPKDLDRLYEHDLPIVCGMYPKKELKLRWVMSAGKVFERIDDNLVRVQEAGTGFMLIKREVFEAMIEANPEDQYWCEANEDLRHDFFKVGTYREDPEQEHSRYLSEDWYFCAEARKLGYHTYVDTRVMLNHIGNFKYPATKDELEDALSVFKMEESAN